MVLRYFVLTAALAIEQGSITQTYKFRKKIKTINCLKTQNQAN